MTVSNISELWLYLKCKLMGFCNLMYCKSNTNFHRFIFLLCISHCMDVYHARSKKNLEIRKVYLSIYSNSCCLELKWSVHWLCKSNRSFVHKTCPIMFSSSLISYLIILSYLRCGSFIRWCNEWLFSVQKYKILI